MRTSNSIKNICIGMIGQVFTILLQFLVRSIFIYKLGIEYLGVNGLFVNIISILSLAELGIGNAIIFSLYKPLNSNDDNKIKALMNLYEKSYKIVALIVMMLGIILIPFLQLIIKETPDIKENIIVLYLLFLLNSVFSYLYAYKRSLIIADQKEYIVTTITNILNFISSIIQIFVIMVFNNFIIYLIVQIIFTLITNICISYKANVMYPMLKDKNKIKLDKDEQKRIFKDVNALIIYKIGTLLTVGLDNIIISSFVGVSSVGVYSNYTMLVDKINSILSQMFGSLTGSIGNLNASEDVDKKEFMYKVMLFMAFFLYGISATCFYVGVNSFIELWVGKEYLLDNITLVIIIANFYFIGMNIPTMIFRNTLGLYVQGRYRPIIGAAINIVVSLAFVREYGILGVVLGTLVSRILVLSWYEPLIIYKNSLKKDVKTYYCKYFCYIAVVICNCIISDKLSYLVITKFQLDLVLSLIIKIIISIMVTIITVIILFQKTNEYKYLKSVFKYFFEKTITKNLKIV